jgi:hypothetical protein
MVLPTTAQEATMKQDELRPDTLGQLIEGGTVFTAADGRTLILGDTDTVAFQDDFGWQVAENVFWNHVEDVDFSDQILKRYARSWIHDNGSRVRREMAVEVADAYSIPYNDAVRVVEHISNAVITID